MDAIEAARRAQTEWGMKTVRERTRALRRLRRVVAARMDEVARVISEDVGKPPMDALAGDVMVVLETLRYCECEAARVLRGRRVGKPALLFSGARFSETHEPHGVVLVIAPWNYPLQLAMVPAVTALAAGNAVVMKCSERAPKTAKMIESLFQEAGFAEGLVQVSSGGAEVATAMIAARPDFVFFTGSSANGRRVALQAAELLIPAVLELGGKDACVVFDSCDLNRTVEGVCYGAFSNAGQVCVGTKRVYVQRGIWERFLPALVARAQELRVGDDVSSDIGRVVFADVRERLAGQVDEAVERGAVLHTAWDRSAAVVPPLVLTGVAEDARLMVEETFGPVVCVAAFEREEDAVRMANGSAFALSASVFTGDRAQGKRVAAKLRGGSCTVNDAIRSVGNPYAAFGGNGQSGYGRYHGAAGLLAFSRVKGLMEVRRPKAKEVHWFPFEAKTYTALRWLMRVRHAGGSMWRRVFQ